ncbi:two-component system sensor histidine kinase NtrB [Clostridium sp.]
MYRCNVYSTLKNSFNKLENLGLGEILHSDWIGLITIDSKNNIIINNSADYKNIGNSNIINLLTTIKEEIFDLETRAVRSIYENHANYYFILAPLWEEGHIKILFVGCNLDKKYNESDLDLLNLISTGSYENVILKNEIEKEKNYLQNIFDSTDSGIISIDLEGKITKVNKKIYAKFGIEELNYIGKNYYDYIAENQVSILKKDIDNIIHNNVVISYENIIYKNMFNKKIVINATVSPLIDGLKYVYGIVISANNVTKAKISEKELEQVKLTNFLGDVSAEIAHEIRNPLMGIRGCARILQKGIDKNSKQYNFIESIVSEVDSVNEIIEKFLAYSRINKDDTNTLVDLNEVLDKCSDLIVFYKEEKYIVVKKNLSEKLPRIKGSVVKLQQAFINILINAVQAIEDEGIIIISTSYLEHRKEVIVEISDNGKGIAQDKVDDIFDPYYSTKEDGTGLGLSITKKIIKKSGGEIYISSKEDLGTKFQIVFQFKEMM